MLNKKARNIIFLVSALITFSLLLWLCGAAGTGMIKYTTTDETDIKIYRYYGAAGCIYLMEKNNIPVDKDYKKIVKDTSADFINHVNIRNTGSSDLSKLICISEFFGLDVKEELYSELHKRYNKDAALFDEKIYDTYSGMTEDQKLAMQLAATDAIFNVFDSFGISDPEYDIKQLLADSFNKNIDKYDHNDIYNGVWTVTSELENIFYYFLATDNLSLIKYEKIWDVIGSGYVRDLFETNKEQSSFVEKSIENMSAILTDNKAHNILGANINIPYTPQQYYNSLTTSEAFEYYPSSEKNSYYEYTLFVDLCKPDSLKLSENEYFTGNVSGWLSDNLKNFRN